MGKVVWGRFRVDFSGFGAGLTVFSVPPMGRFRVDFNGFGAALQGLSALPVGELRSLGACSDAFSFSPAGRLGVDFNALAPGFWSLGFAWVASGICSSYSLMIEVQFAPNPYCRRDDGGLTGPEETFVGYVRPNNERPEVKVCRMFLEPEYRLPPEKKNRRKTGNVLTEGLAATIF
jgi:hypothetical protein